MRIAVALLAVAASILAACADDGTDTRGSAGVDGIQVPDGYAVEIIVEGLSGPTQVALAPDRRLVVAELNGAERAGTGRVLLIDLDDPTTRRTLVDALLTPTGVAVDGDLLWIMEQRRLTVGPIAEPTDRTVVLDDLPYNGRSEGTISAVAGGGILYDTSGRLQGGRLAEGAGALWYLAGPDSDPVQYATGFKHAYAHTPVDDTRWFVTEISDGRLDGRVPPDELVIAASGDDFAFPRCIGDRVPVAEFGGTAANCAGSPRSLAVFAPGSTPTSVVVAPWDPELVLVALWNQAQVVAVPASPVGQPHSGAPFLSGIEHPQFLLADGARLLVVDFDSGRVLAVTAQ